MEAQLKKTMKKLLAISWAMPPLLFPRSIQVARTLKTLLFYGWQSTVVSVKPESLNKSKYIDNSLEGVYANCAEIYHVPSQEGNFLYRGVSGLFRILTQFPDKQSIWITPAYKKAEKLLNHNRFSVLISFAQPWSDHLIGLKLHQSKGIPWIAHFSDPWVDSPYLIAPHWQRKILHRMEKSVINEANAIIFVNTLTLEQVMSKYPVELRKKAFVVPHGFDEEAFSFIKKVPEQKRSSCLTILHVGNFYNHRNPIPLIDALSLLQKNGDYPPLRIIFIGHYEPWYKTYAKNKNLSANVSFLGTKSYLESTLHLMLADALLVIDAPGKLDNVFLPSKLIEYLAFNKPIFGITPNNSASAKLLQSIDSFIAPPDDNKAIADCILNMLNLWQRGELKMPSTYNEIISSYNIHNTTKLLLDIITYVTKT